MADMALPVKQRNLMKEECCVKKQRNLMKEECCVKCLTEFNKVNDRSVRQTSSTWFWFEREPCFSCSGSLGLGFRHRLILAHLTAPVTGHREKNTHVSSIVLKVCCRIESREYDTGTRRGRQRNRSFA